MSLGMTLNNVDLSINSSKTICNSQNKSFSKNCLFTVGTIDSKPLASLNVAYDTNDQYQYNDKDNNAPQFLSRGFSNGNSSFDFSTTILNMLSSIINLSLNSVDGFLLGLVISNYLQQHLQIHEQSCQFFDTLFHFSQFLMARLDLLQHTPLCPDSGV
jgi:hypothetical protein